MTVSRSSDDMQVECKKQDTDTGLAKLISRANGGMVGNIIFGGGIGAIIDHNKGTGYSYPDNVVVIMGDTIVIDRAVQEREEQEKAANQKSASAK